MTGAGVNPSQSCTNCGEKLAGKFCAQCGTPAVAFADDAQEGWGGVTRELLDSRSRKSFLTVLLSFFRHPVDTIIQLTDDPTYRSHWTFLSLVLGAQLTLTFVLLPKLFETMFGIPQTIDKSAVISTQIVQYAGIAILTPFQYYLCRLLGNRQRSPMSYVKLCVLSVSFCTIMSTINLLIFFTLITLTQQFTLPIDFEGLDEFLRLILQSLILIFVTLAHMRFWDMKLPVAAVVTILMAAASWLVVYPGLTWLAQSTNIGTTLNELLG